MVGFDTLVTEKTREHDGEDRERRRPWSVPIVLLTKKTEERSSGPMASRLLSFWIVLL